MTSDSSSIAVIRSQFPVFERKVYLNSCSQGALSKRVEDAFDEYLWSWHEQSSPWDLWIEKYGEHELCLQNSLTPSPMRLHWWPALRLNSMASALSFRERQKVVLGKLEFSTTDNIWLWQANPGAEIIFLDAQDERLTAKASEPAINRETPIVTLAHLCFRNAIRSLVSDVERIAHECGARVLLDDYPDFGTRPVDVKVMNLDFDVSGTLKYLLGPPG